MNSRERVLAAIHHREVDRIPVDLWALPPVTDKLRSHFKMDNDEAVREALGVDLRSVWPKYIGPEYKTFEDSGWIDWWGIRKKMLGDFEEIMEHPLSNASTVDDVLSHSWPDPDWFDYAGLKKRCERLRGYALVIRDPGPYSICVLRVAMYLRSMDKFMMDLVMNPEFAKAVIDQVGQFYMEMSRRILESIGHLTDIYFIADDVGMQDGLMISPEMFSEFLEPILKQFIRQAKGYGQRIMYHSCGTIRSMIPKFIELGIDILNPIQTSAKDMEPAALKKEFGKALCFHGALDIQTVLSRGTPAEVKAEVLNLCALLGEGGGFILAPTNNIMPETPLKNILALYEAVRERKSD